MAEIDLLSNDSLWPVEPSPVDDFYSTLQKRGGIETRGLVVNADFALKADSPFDVRATRKFKTVQTLSAIVRSPEDPDQCDVAVVEVSSPYGIGVVFTDFRVVNFDGHRPQILGVAIPEIPFCLSSVESDNELMPPPQESVIADFSVDKLGAICVNANQPLELLTATNPIQDQQSSERVVNGNMWSVRPSDMLQAILQKYSSQPHLLRSRGIATAT